jgi:hypothetical protein
MKTTLRQRLLIAVGISAGVLASMNLFAQEANTSAPKYTIHSQAEYVKVVGSINELASKLYTAHQNYPSLAYSHVYDGNGALMGFTVTGIPQSAVADEISGYLMELEALGNAVYNADEAFMPASKNNRLTSRVSKKKAMESVSSVETTDGLIASTPRDLTASYK